MNRTIFFKEVKPLFGGRFTQDQVNGLGAILDIWEGQDLRYTAYGLGTAYLETNKSMQPVEEGYYLGSRAKAFQKKLRYYPWYGRGYVQLTWEDNYKKADLLLGLNGRLVTNLSLALDPKIAAQIMLRGMTEGWFTGKKLSNYFTKTGSDWINARRIINKLDRASEIAQVAQKFYRAIVNASNGVDEMAVKKAPALPVVAALAGVASSTILASPAARVVGAIVGKVLARQDVPLPRAAVQETTEKVMEAVHAEVADQKAAIVPVKSGWFSKINWTAAVTPFASVVSMVLAKWQLNFSPEEIIELGGAIQVAGSGLVVLFRQFFTKTVTPQSLGV